MVLPQAMAWVQYWFRVLSLKFCGKSKKNCGDISQVSPAFCMYAYVLDMCQPFNLGHPRGTCKPVEHLGWGGGCVRQVSITGRVRRVGVFDFGTGRVGYLQKSLGTGTGRDGYWDNFKGKKQKRVRFPKTWKMSNMWHFLILKWMRITMMAMMICRTIISQTSNSCNLGSRWVREEPKKGKLSKYNFQADGHLSSGPAVHV